MTNEELCSDYLFYLKPELKVVIKSGDKIKEIKEIKEAIATNEKHESEKVIEIVI